MNYIIAAGGTGMRCLESFVHLCAMGMFDRKTFHLLLIDTDHDNGNLERTRNLLKDYIKIKGGSESTQEAFFTAQLKLYEFISNYGENESSFENIVRQTNDLQDGQTVDKVALENDMLLNLLVDTNSQVFDLTHGYRSQTHIGSDLMYHDIVYGRDGVNRSQLEDFLGIMQADPDKDKRVFVFGSLFGGTGASAIPVLPTALERAAYFLDPNGAVKFAGFTYGATLLTNYFTFRAPGESQLEDQKVIASATEFSLNSKAALMYYENDASIRQKYKRFYLVGWPGAPTDFSNTGNNGVITGGAAQRNDVHTTELMCAFAAHDFFRETNLGSLEWKFRSVDFNNNLFDYHANSFTDQHPDFQKKMYAFLGFCMMLKKEYFRANGEIRDYIKVILSDKALRPKCNNIEQLTNDSDTLDAINNYVSAFTYSIKNKELTGGWIQQLKNRGQSNTFLQVNLDVFSSTQGTLEKLAWGKLHANEHNKERHFGVRSILSDNPFDVFVNTFRGIQPVNVGSAAENLFAAGYQIFNILHKYNNN